MAGNHYLRRMLLVSPSTDRAPLLFSHFNRQPLHRCKECQQHTDVWCASLFLFVDVRFCQRHQIEEDWPEEARAEVQLCDLLCLNVTLLEDPCCSLFCEWVINRIGTCQTGRSHRKNCHFLDATSIDGLVGFGSFAPGEFLLAFQQQMDAIREEDEKKVQLWSLEQLLKCAEHLLA